MQVEWFDRTGKRLESVRGGSMVTNGVDLVGDLTGTIRGRGVAARFGPTPANLRRLRTLTRAPAGHNLTDFDLAVAPSGQGLFAWTLSPAHRDCGVWVQASETPYGEVSSPACAADSDADRPRVSVDTTGRFRLAWRTQTSVPGAVIGRIWVREAKVGT
jgi:hypothetical protein